MPWPRRSHDLHVNTLYRLTRYTASFLQHHCWRVYKWGIECFGLIMFWKTQVKLTGSEQKRKNLNERKRGTEIATTALMNTWNSLRKDVLSGCVLFFSSQLCFFMALSYNSITAAWTSVSVGSDLRRNSFHPTMVENVWRRSSQQPCDADSVLFITSLSSAIPRERWAVAKSCKTSGPWPFQPAEVMRVPEQPSQPHPSSGKDICRLRNPAETHERVFTTPMVVSSPHK